MSFSESFAQLRVELEHRNEQTASALVKCQAELDDVTSKVRMLQMVNEKLQVMNSHFPHSPARFLHCFAYALCCSLCHSVILCFSLRCSLFLTLLLSICDSLCLCLSCPLPWLCVPDIVSLCRPRPLRLQRRHRKNWSTCLLLRRSQITNSSRRRQSGQSFRSTLKRRAPRPCRRARRTVKHPKLRSQSWKNN